MTYAIALLLGAGWQAVNAEVSETSASPANGGATLVVSRGTPWSALSGKLAGGLDGYDAASVSVSGDGGELSLSLLFWRGGEYRSADAVALLDGAPTTVVFDLAGARLVPTRGLGPRPAQLRLGSDSPGRVTVGPLKLR